MFCNEGLNEVKGLPYTQTKTIQTYLRHNTPKLEKKISNIHSLLETHTYIIHSILEAYI